MFVCVCDGWMRYFTTILLLSRSKLYLVNISGFIGSDVRTDVRHENLENKCMFKDT